ncbi:lysophospholipid acyltransferase family protein [Sulfuricurvum sp.]|uniref:lysophospholipid acyltransferase family protein n=1 Tax=Sulfuricurvum sp. TaxID=2025608 RepID=UPI002631CF83|nr:lysophospholipid acyltransferase family protein [Sulfuricurvum sp.]MDD2265554.1 lysophospholipid acyltransferase family protein [Sulfuricurvum sp.]MDD2783197.1 lysophospholipid acyltransferase family protein [Sulfuricurvum sp.]
MRKRFLRSLALWLIPPIGTLLIRFIYLTNKKRFHLPTVVPSEPVIFAFWHGDLLLQPYLYYQFRASPKANVLISDHFDGQIIARIMRYFKLGTIHGSTTRGGAKVLIQALKSLNEGYDIGITPDGPKGPRHEMSDGVVIMAQKRKTKVIVYSCVPSRYWQLPSWDRFTVPKPFGTLDFYASEPINLEGLEMEAAKSVIKEKLMEHVF